MQTKQRRVLWIDDDVRPDTFDLTVLTGGGYAVDCATSAGEGLTQLRENSYDAILLDLHLPDQSGLDVLQIFSSWHIATPIVILTGFGDVESAVTAMKLGAVDYREKPLDGADLLSVLRGVCEAAAASSDRPVNARWIEGVCDRLSLCGTEDECLRRDVPPVAGSSLGAPLVRRCSASTEAVTHLR